MEVRYSPDRQGFKRMDTQELRQAFLIDLFKIGAIQLVYSDIDRSITGSAVPQDTPLKLTASKKEMAADYFTQRRELGIINIGGEGSVTVDGNKFSMENRDALYVGKGAKEIEFKSANANNPAKFYLLSYPAHTQYPTEHIKFSETSPLRLGSDAEANKRTIYKYIYPDGVKSCQLVMGLTELEKGSVWNTMPAHTHQRRSEIYMYFDLSDDAFVVHLIGHPNETRHLIIRNEQAVLSPSWSLHSGAGTENYSFIWGMGGENQDFDDMDWIPMKELL